MSRGFLALVLALWALAAPLGAPGPAAAKAASKPDAATPSFVLVDLGGGAILQSEGLDAPRYPASLVKLMTVYLAFEALEEGRIHLDQPVKISDHAAGQAPVKAGLSAGDRYPFGALLAAAAVASSNDAAVAVAEALGGTETAFVALMTQAARRLGMRATRFANASGLPERPKKGAPPPDPQRTTARDMALLAQALIDRFPERIALLGQASAKIGGRRLASTNALITGYDGARGLKTGYTCAAGHAIAAYAVRGGRRLLAVYLAGPGKAARGAAVRDLLDAGFAAPPDGAPLAPADLADLSALERPTPKVRSCSGGGGGKNGGLRGWATLIGAFRTEGAARAALAQLGGGAPHLYYRKRDRKWLAFRHAMSRSTAIAACLRARRAGRYCLTLPPEVVRNRRASWR